MPTRNPSAAARQAVDKRRVEGRARAVCGLGSMAEVIDENVLKDALKRLHSEDPAKAGLIMLHRAKEAMDAVAPAAKGGQRISKAVARTVWKLLSLELSFAVKNNPRESVKALKHHVEELNNNKQLDMGAVRDFMGRGWPGLQTVHGKCTLQELGPLQWWYAVNELQGTKPIHRQTIYNGALEHFEGLDRLETRSARSRSPTPTPTPSQPTLPPSLPPNASVSQQQPASSSSRPARQAANATNAALRAATIVDDDRGPTYSPNQRNVSQNERESGQFKFGSGMPADFTASATLQPPPPPEDNAGVVARKAQPSPWLAPSGFSADLKWDIGNYIHLINQLMQYPSGKPLPDNLIWEHPEMHGLPVDQETGQALQYTQSCTNCRKRLRRCIYRGAKACLPCFWDKGSSGKCEGGVAPVLTPAQLKNHKPDFRRRLHFIERLVAARKMKFPSHYLDNVGRSLHGAASGGTGRAPRYVTPAPAYSPGNPIRSAPAPPPALSPAPPSAPVAQAVDSLKVVRRDPAVTSPSELPSRSDPAPTALAFEGVHRSPLGRNGGNVAPQPMDIDTAGDAAPVQARDEDVEMFDPSATANPAGKRTRQDDGDSGSPPAAGADASVRPQKRRRVEDTHGAPAESPSEQAVPVPEAASNGNVAPPVIPPRPRPALSVSSESREGGSIGDDSEEATSGPGSEKVGKPKGKGRARPAKPLGEDQRRPKPAGEEQRRPMEKGFEIREPAGVTRTIPRAGSPTAFRARPTPVIPDYAMRVEGITNISHPRSYSSDVVMSNIIERSVRNEARDSRDQQREWMTGTFKHEHMLPQHRDVMHSLDDIKSMLRNPSHLSTAASAVTASPPSNGISDAAMQQMFAVLADTLTRSLNVSVTDGVKSGLEDGLKGVHTRLDIIEPVVGDVQKLHATVHGLEARLRAVEDTRQAASVLQLTQEPHDPRGSADAVLPHQLSLPVTSGPAVSSAPAKVREASGPVQRTPLALAHGAQPPSPPSPAGADVSGALFQAREASVPATRTPLRPAQGAEPSSPPGAEVSASGTPRLSGVAQVPGAASSSPAGAEVPAPGTPDLKVVDARVLGAGVDEDAALSAPHVPVSQESDRNPPASYASVEPRTVPAQAASGSGQLQAAIERDRDILSRVPARPRLPSRDGTPTPKPKPRVVTRTAVSAVAADDGEAGPHTPEQNMSPLTADPSPGNVIGESVAAGGDTSADEAPMETGDDWLPGPRQKRPATDQPRGQRAPKRHAGEADTSEDEDAEGSVVDSEATLTGPGPSAAPARGGNARGRGTAVPSVAATPGRRSGLRSRPARGG